MSSSDKNWRDAHKELREKQTKMRQDAIELLKRYVEYSIDNPNPANDNRIENFMNTYKPLGLVKEDDLTNIKEEIRKEKEKQVGGKKQDKKKYVSHLGKRYVVHTGKRSGKYILVGERKIYI